ncbi:MAG: hypothetical protein P9M14_12820 [Candidatus Alcyoniella australis]|nr:hypothetical protein [Candidatus Alcyoniella australis]
MCRRWSCENCGKLLGTFADGRVNFRVRKSQYTATVSNGTTLIEAVCPKCSRLNELKVKSAAIKKPVTQ